MLPDYLKSAKGLLLDLNGVFYVGSRVLPGAQAAIAALQKSGLPYRFVTNNTTQCTQSMSQSLATMGLAIAPTEIITTASAAVLQLRQMGNPKIYPLVAADAQQEFAEFTWSDMDADVIVVGDIGDDWNYRIMNRVFRLLMKGAQLIALHRGKYWQWEAGLQLDIGAFVAGLEYATDQKAIVSGKPDPFFYKIALANLGLPPAEVVMIGDDLEADVQGAQAMGMKAVVVQTGKYRPHLASKMGITPDGELTGIGAIADWFA
ncbi:TIGR01458 family HAD-type hydrolase [Leptolyngbya iicbica]|uniref:Haloacid dehalogenase-like hydrolase domain-containing protein 2 n=2 Tax=Cyanophyceae TaxID=3028117 RepID=A0A4Q7E4Z8_9CYAN|nr:TIGR01458 family HAD-type hydrolase [Leptolyngbya sp. LK]RZM77207.1 TIGR01458 family HAD-type hydrolase [Leptolyngbya sp. LK]